jgi:hypothetical protein
MQERVKPKTAASSRMVRKQLFVTAEQNQRLKALAAGTGKSEGQLIREGLDDRIAREPAGDQDWKAVWMKAAGMWADYPEVHEKLARGRASWGARRKRLPGETKD